MLTLKHKGGEVIVVVPAAAPVVTFGIGHIDQLKPGAHIFIEGRACPTAPSPRRASSWAAGGLVPPM